MESGFKSLTVPTPHLAPHLTRVTGTVCEIWIELALGVEPHIVGVLAARPSGGDGLVVPLTGGFVWACDEALALHKLPIWFIFVDCRY